MSKIIQTYTPHRHTEIHSHKPKPQQHKQTKLTWRGFQRGTRVTWTAVFFMAPLVDAKHSNANGQCCYYCWQKKKKITVSQRRPKPCQCVQLCMMNLGLILTVKLHECVNVNFAFFFSSPPHPCVLPTMKMSSLGEWDVLVWCSGGVGVFPWNCVEREHKGIVQCDGMATWNA